MGYLFFAMIMLVLIPLIGLGFKKFLGVSMD